MDNTGPGEVRLFVSHHSSTYETALRVEELLVARGVSCWIAPRDVEPGEPFDKAISKAILGSAAILLLFCEKSDKSRHVKRELILGDSAARPIIPLRLEAIDPGELAYHLADSQWIDWIDRREAVMDRVAAQARQYAAVMPEIDGPIPPTHRADTPARAPVANKMVPYAGVLALVLVAIAATWWLSRPDNGGEAELAASEGLPVTDTDGQLAIEPAVDREVAEDLSVPSPTPSATGPAPSLPPPPVVIASREPSTASAPPTVAATPAPSPGPLNRVVDGCRGAASDTEYLICADPTLNARAGEIGDLIRQARAALADQPDDLRRFNTEQRSWFNGVKATCHDAACVTRMQNERITVLRRLVARQQ